MKKQKSPQQILIEVLKGTNPIAHMFILDAVSKNIENVLENKEELKEAFKKSLINGDAWIDAAEHLKASLNWK